MVGDVCGTGAEAAAITSQVRYTARALAGRVGSVAQLLVEVNAALLERADTRFCTALAAVLEPGPEGVKVTMASGGHPAPVLISHEGTRLVDVRGTLLGVYEDIGGVEASLELRSGESLVLYTDGVTESRDPHGVLLGEERLVDLLHACVGEHAEKTATQLIEAAVQHAALGPADDIAVLVVRCATEPAELAPGHLA
jgi:serine phosphatase RsbU (regulator of sigma subunit)